MTSFFFYESAFSEVFFSKFMPECWGCGLYTSVYGIRVSNHFNGWIAGQIYVTITRPCLHFFILHGCLWCLKDFSAVSKCQTYLHKYGSHACVLRLRNIVREAFVMSVICKPPFEPPVMFWSMKKNNFLWAINFKKILIIWYLVTISFILYHIIFWRGSKFFGSLKLLVVLNILPFKIYHGFTAKKSQTSKIHKWLVSSIFLLVSGFFG